ncbi:MAG: hypothetical protein HY927_01765 [Elusimicrobia bacterium]|nr:hypothetical protein [Elusimicrobiota bacterium]
MTTRLGRQALVLAAAISVVTALASGARAEDAKDSLQLRSGTTLLGRALGFDRSTVVFKTAAGQREFKRAEVEAILFGGPEAAVGSLPSWLSARDGLKVARWMTFRRITRFARGEDNKAINAAKISANGSKIAFAAYQGTFVIDPDGSNLVKLGGKRNDAMIDISADGRKVVWLDQDGLFMADSDGSGRVKVAFPFQVTSLRMTADGAALVVFSRDQGSLYRVQPGGSEPRRITGNPEVAKVLGYTDYNGYMFSESFGISNDASRIVIQFWQDVAALNGDGTGLRRLNGSRKPDDRSLKWVRLSGDGRRVAYHNSEEPAITVVDWDGGNQTVHAGPFTASTDWMQVSGNGGKVLSSWGLRLFDGGGQGRLDASYWPVSDPLYRASMASMSADAKRVCLVLEGPESVDQGRPSQLVVVDLNPMEQNGAPPLHDIDASPRFLLADGSTFATVTARSDDPELKHLDCTALRDGIGVKNWYAVPSWMNDNGEHGDAKAKDGLFTNGRFHFGTGGRGPMDAGPLTLRVVAFNNANHALVVDLEGLETRKP